MRFRENRLDSCELTCRKRGFDSLPPINVAGLDERIEKEVAEVQTFRSFCTLSLKPWLVVSWPPFSLAS